MIGKRVISTGSYAEPEHAGLVGTVVLTTDRYARVKLDNGKEAYFELRSLQPVPVIDKRLTQEQKSIVRQMVGAAQSCVHRDMRKSFLRRHIRLAIELIRND